LGGLRNDQTRKVAPIYAGPVDGRTEANKEIIELMPVIVKGIIKAVKSAKSKLTHLELTCRSKGAASPLAAP
jgi:hypothetical protein